MLLLKWWPFCLSLSVLKETRAWFNLSCLLTSIWNPTVEIRWSKDYIVSTTEIFTLVRQHLHIESTSTPIKILIQMICNPVSLWLLLDLANYLLGQLEWFYRNETSKFCLTFKQTQMRYCWSWISFFFFFLNWKIQGAVSIRKTVFPGMAIPMLKIRRPNGRLIFNMEIAIRR